MALAAWLCCALAGAAGLRSNERDQLCAVDRARALHSVSLPRRRLLGTGPRNVPADDRYKPQPAQSVDPGYAPYGDPQQPVLFRKLEMARRADPVRGSP